MNFKDNILGFIPEEAWLDIGFEPTIPNDPIDGLFGDVLTNNIVAYWQTLATEYQVPMMAQFHGYDTEAQKTVRVPVDTHHVEKGLIKVKIDQSERMRALLRSGVRESELYDYVIRDGVNLAEQVFTRSKVAKNELLATGKVTIKENNLNLTVDYGVSEDQTGFELDFADGKDVPAQLQNIIDSALSSGVALTGMVTSRRTLSKMRQHASVQKAVNGNIGVGAIVSQAAFEAYLAMEYGITNVVTNDLVYATSNGIGTDGRPSMTNHRYFPENTVTFFAANPAGMLGVGAWGEPPEADVGSLATGAYDTNHPYVYIDQWTENDPKVLWTKASGLFMPILYNPSSLWIAKVKANPTV